MSAQASEEVMQIPRAVFGVASHQGRVRDHNEDSFLARPPVFAVADGMGGHAAGEIASRLAVESLAGKDVSAWRGGSEALRHALDDANRSVFSASKGNVGSRGMGTTCVILLLDSDLAHLGHVGDSRIYRFRDGSLEQLTRDHTVLGEMVAHGLLTPQQALADGDRGTLTRALGAAAGVEADLASVAVRAGDLFLLCSDGQTSMVPDPVISQVLAETGEPQAAADRLIAAANDAGGADNVTALVVEPVPAIEASGRPGIDGRLLREAAVKPSGPRERARRREEGCSP